MKTPCFRAGALAFACALFATPASAVYVDFKGGGSVLNAGGSVYFQIEPNAPAGYSALPLAPEGNPGDARLLLIWQWYQEWLWVGFAMPEWASEGKTFDHFLGQDYIWVSTGHQQTAGNSTVSVRGVRLMDRDFTAIMTDGSAVTRPFKSTLTFEVGRGMVAGGATWKIGTYDVPDAASTGTLFLAILLLAAVRHALPKVVA